MEKINQIFSGLTVEQIIENLKSDGSEWANQTVNTLSKMSPTSLKITLRLLQLGSEMELQECLAVEYRLSQRCCENNDFKEGREEISNVNSERKFLKSFLSQIQIYVGVRALLIDKDQSPKWDPSTLEGVTQEIVDHFFSPLPDGRDISL